jgi:hypothetical protein
MRNYAEKQMLFSISDYSRFLFPYAITDKYEARVKEIENYLLLNICPSLLVSIGFAACPEQAHP